MSKIYGLSLTFLFVLLNATLTAQASCQYFLEMLDSFGDGWNGGNLTIATGGDTTDYTLTPALGDGDAFTASLDVNDGDVIVLSYEPGAFPTEVSFNLISADCEVLYNYEGFSNIAGDSIFLDTISCPTCVAPQACGELDFQRLRSNSVEVLYGAVEPTDPNDALLYLIEFGATGFTPITGSGTVLTTTDTIFRIQPLEENTTYDIYVRTLCSMGTDTSGLTGPLTITTPFARDIGITRLSDPVSGCGLGQEEVEIALTNFGGMAQTLFRVGISINDEVLPINYPSDGFYTGVLGVDSTEFTSFDLMPDFSQPGTYELKLWTELDDDAVATNDTLVAFVYSTTTEDEFPYYENFENDDDFWFDQEGDPLLSSWERGQPNGEDLIEAAGGQNAWVTNLDGFAPQGELSFLYTPCFDLSDLTEDPLLSFSFFNDIDGFNSNLTLEATTNGVDYVKVGAAGDGLNWYNDFFNDYWEEAFGVTPVWRPTAIVLDGFAGEPLVRFRYRFEMSNFFSQGDGVGIDNFLLTPQTEAELAALSVRGPEGQDCGSGEDFPSIEFFNLGSEPATDFELNYQVNGGPVVTEIFMDTLASFESANYTFMTPYNGTLADTNVIVAWVNIDADQVVFNDTTITSVPARRELPYFEDFEEGFEVLDEWITNGPVNVGFVNGSPTQVLFSNMFTFSPGFSANTPNYGPIAAGDSLVFLYRATDFGSGGSVGTVFNPGDSLTVDLIVDCDSIVPGFVRINADNHVTTTGYTRVAVPLPDYVIGRNLQLLFEGSSDVIFGSDFYLELDNINLKRCVPEFVFDANVMEAPDSMGFGFVNLDAPEAGIPPFTYAWSNGDNSPVATGLAPGDYQVTITDAQGCTQVLGYTIVISNVSDPVARELERLEVFPNPTRGGLTLRWQQTEGREVSYQLMNQFGQVLENRNLGRQQLINQQINLDRQPAGIYFLRVFSGGASRTVRVVRTR